MVGQDFANNIKVVYFLSLHGGSIGVVIFLLAASNGKISNFAKPRSGAFEVFFERRNELAKVLFCLNVSNGIHRYLSALVSNLGSGRYKLIGRASRDDQYLHAGEWMEVCIGTGWVAVQVQADVWGR